MSVHYLKTWPPFFNAVVSGRKTFELRKDDREFGVGDTLVLQEWDPDKVAKHPTPSAGYTGRDVRVRVNYLVLPFDSFGALAEGFCVMGISLIAAAPDPGRKS